MGFRLRPVSSGVGVSAGAGGRPAAGRATDPAEAGTALAAALVAQAGQLAAAALWQEQRLPCRHDRQSAQHLATHRRDQAETLAQATAEGGHWRQPWTAAEMETALRKDLTAAQAALALGRSLNGVKNARRKHYAAIARETKPGFTVCGPFE